MKILRLCLAVALAASAGAALAQLYRWTDAQGRVHVTDTPPPPGAKDVKKETRAPAASRPEDPGNEPYALQLARKNAPVTLYTTPGCEACAQARTLLNARGIPFSEVSVVDPKTLQQLKSAAGTGSVPAMIVGSTVQKGGFEEGVYNQVLDDAGYPKAGVLPPRSQTEPKAPPRVEAKPAEPEAPRGPYAPGAPPQRSQKK